VAGGEAARRERGRLVARREVVVVGAGVLVLGATVACGPEAERTRGGDAGADIGNRGSPVVLLQEEYATRVFYETPNDQPPISGPAGPIPTLEPATPRPPSAATPIGATPGPAPFGSPPPVPTVAATPGAVPPAAVGGTTDTAPVAAPFASPIASPVT